MATTKDVVAPLTETGAAVVQGPFAVSEATAGAVMPPPIAVDPVVEEPPVRSAWRESGKKAEEKAENGKKTKADEKAEK